MRSLHTTTKSSPARQLEEPRAQQQRPNAAINLFIYLLNERRKESITGRLQDIAVSQVLIMSKKQNVSFNTCLHKKTEMKFVKFSEID